MKKITKYWFLEGFNIFKKVGIVNVLKMCDVLEMDNFTKGKEIELFEEHKDYIFFLKKGSVKIVDKANDTVKYVIKRGHIFGELSLFDKDAASKEIAYALEDCIICYMDSDQMGDFMMKHKSLKNELFKVYGLRIKKLERRLNDLLYKDSASRIREFIMDYLEEFGERDEENTLKAKNLLSHKDIANLTSTSRQTVSNVLSMMRKEGIIDYNSKYICNIN